MIAWSGVSFGLSCAAYDYIYFGRLALDGKIFLMVALASIIVDLNF